MKPAALATMATSGALAGRPYLSMPATGIPQTYRADFGTTAGRHHRPGGTLDRRAPGDRIGHTRPARAAPLIRSRSTSEYGDSTTAQAASGTAYSLPLSDQVTYLTYPAGDTLSVGPTEPYGTNLAAAAAGATATASSGSASGRHRRPHRRLRPGLVLRLRGHHPVAHRALAAASTSTG